MTKYPFKLLALLLLVLSVALAGCMSDDDGGTSEGAADTTMTHEMDGEAAVTTSGAAADLRITLDRLLSEHATLAQVATQKGLRGEKDFEAIATAVDANSVELSEAIGSVYGDEAAAKFLDGKLLWRDHIEFFVAYTVAKANDQAGQKKAVGDLMGYVEAFSSFLASATDLPKAALRKSITEHVTQLKAQLDAYAAGNYDAAYENERAAYEHMVMTGDTLSGAIVEQSPDKFADGSTTASAADLRVTLGKLLGEHALLAQFATQKGFSGSKDFAAIGAALDANGVELSQAIGSVYGDEAAKTFLDGKAMWRDHIKFFVAYTTALAKKDEAGQRKAVNDLMGYVEAFSRFLSDATGLPQAALRDSITEHVNGLKGQIDAYAAGDYAKAYSLLREATQHMWMTGDTLAAAIVEQNSDKFAS